MQDCAWFQRGFGPFDGVQDCGGEVEEPADETETGLGSFVSVVSCVGREIGDDVERWEGGVSRGIPSSRLPSTERVSVTVAVACNRFLRVE